jgi:hypothetical protein
MTSKLIENEMSKRGKYGGRNKGGRGNKLFYEISKLSLIMKL